MRGKRFVNTSVAGFAKIQPERGNPSEFLRIQLPLSRQGRYNRPAMNVSRKTIRLLALVCLALGLRVAVVAALWTDHARPLSYEHGRIAENLLAGRGFSIMFLGVEGPTSQQAPFYPTLLAAAYGLFGVGSPGAVLAIQLLQCMAGTGLVLAVVWLGHSLAPDEPSVGWVAGIGAAIYPTHLYMVTHLQVVLWAALLLTLLLAVAASSRFRGRWTGAVLAGCLAGAILLVEPILALALPICAIVFWLGEGAKNADETRWLARGGVWGRWKCRFGWGPIGRLALMASVAATMIAPWTARNYAVHGEFVFIKSTFGYAFWQGNNPHSWGTDKVPKASSETIRLEHDGTPASIDRALWEARHETNYIDDVALRPSGYREFVGLSEPQRSRLLGGRAARFVRENPARYGQLCLNRLRYFLLFDDTNPKAANRLYRLSTVVWLALALVGLLATLDRFRRLWPTYAIFGLVMAFHVLVITSVRFRIPLEGLSFIWIGAAMGPLLGRCFRVRRPGIQASEERASDESGRNHVLRGPHWDHDERRRAA